MRSVLKFAISNVYSLLNVPRIDWAAAEKLFIKLVTLTFATMNPLYSSQMSLFTNEGDRGDYRKRYLQERENARELAKKLAESISANGISYQSDVILEGMITELLEKAVEVKT